MEKNDFLSYNEAVYRLHDCQTLAELKTALLTQARLLVPCTYASLIPITRDPETLAAVHGEPVCIPRGFQPVEKAWLAQADQAYTLWMSHAAETMVVRDSEVLAGDNRFAARSYREVYLHHGIVDCVQMNIVWGGQTLGRLALYRTREEGLFTERDTFYLRAMANHVNLAWGRCLREQTRRESTAAGRSMEELTSEYQLTRREEEILDMVFQKMNNEEILERIAISQNTLHKHLQNLYR
ncbi:MAG: GAF domain-containing protein, partial [Evtepia sp.]